MGPPRDAAAAAAAAQFEKHFEARAEPSHFLPGLPARRPVPPVLVTFHTQGRSGTHKLSGAPGAPGTQITWYRGHFELGNSWLVTLKDSSFFTKDLSHHAPYSSVAQKDYT